MQANNQQYLGMPQMGQMGMAGGMMGGMGQMPGAMMGGMGQMPGGMMGGMGQMPGGMMGMQQMGMMPNMGMPGMAGMPGQPALPPGVRPQAPPQAVPAAAPAPVANPTPPPVEWAIPQQKRVGYMAQFQANDKAKTGFLAAVQARSILLQTGLAQQTLAAVWNLSDIDKVSPVLSPVVELERALSFLFLSRTGS